MLSLNAIYGVVNVSHLRLPCIWQGKLGMYSRYRVYGEGLMSIRKVIYITNATLDGKPGKYTSLLWRSSTSPF